MMPWNCSRGSRMAVRASSKACVGVCTPVRPMPVSHSTTKRRSWPARSAASESPRATTSLSSDTVSRLMRRLAAMSRSALAAPRML